MKDPPRRAAEFTWAAALMLISGAVLGFEILLMRLLALTWWGHFASLVVSLAMLGIGGSGLLLHGVRERVLARPEAWFAAGAVIFGVTAPASWILSQAMPFSPFLLTWSASEYVLLGARALLFGIPFLAGGLAIGTAYLAPILGPRRAYGANMIGSAPALAILYGALSHWPPTALLLPTAGLALVAGAMLMRHPLLRAAALLVAVLAVFISSAVPMRFSEYKSLSRVLLLPDSEVLFERTNPEALLTAVRAPHARHHAGLSLNFAGELPPADFIFLDGDGLQAVYDPEAALRDPAFLRMTPEHAAYAAGRRSRILLLSHAGGAEVLRAVSEGAHDVTILENPPLSIRAVLELWKRRGFDPASRGVRLKIEASPVRQYLGRDKSRYDLILVSLGEEAFASSEGGASLSADWTWTTEGLAALFAALDETGCLVIPAPTQNPPRAFLRVAATIGPALARCGVSDPSAHVTALRGWSTCALLVSRAPWDGAALAAIARFREENLFDAVFYPGMAPGEGNLFHVIPGNPYAEGVAALLGSGREEFLARNPFRIEPITDDRPFPGHFLRWSAVPDLVERFGAEWLPYVEWNYLTQLAALLVIGLIAVVVFVWPCARLGFPATPASLAYFFALGIGYMFVEIHAIFLAERVLGRPLAGTALVLAVMLGFSAGGGMALAGARRRGAIRGTFFALLTALGAYWGGSVFLADRLAVLTGPIPLAACAALIALPAFFMGFPFPFGLAASRSPREIPWALAMNGIGSVIGSLGALLIAVHFGLSLLALCGLAAYLAAALLRKSNARGNPIDRAESSASRCNA